MAFKRPESPAQEAVLPWGWKQTWALALLALGLSFSCSACGSSAEEVCQDYKEALLTYYQSKCDPLVADSAAEMLEQLLDCSKALQVRDEQALYERCLPALEERGCDPLSLAVPFPSSCEGQFYFAPPQIF